MREKRLPEHICPSYYIPNFFSPLLACYLPHVIPNFFTPLLQLRRWTLSRAKPMERRRHQFPPCSNSPLAAAAPTPPIPSLERTLSPLGRGQASVLWMPVRGPILMMSWIKYGMISESTIKHTKNYAMISIRRRC